MPSPSSRCSPTDRRKSRTTTCASWPRPASAPPTASWRRWGTCIARYSLAVLPGDGIGPEVIAEACKVLRASQSLDVRAARRPGRRRGHRRLRHGPTPETVELAQASDAVLFGAVGGPKWDDPKAPVRPEQAILGLRAALGTFANLRPGAHAAGAGAPVAAQGRDRPGRRRPVRPRARRRDVLRRAQEVLAGRRRSGAPSTPPPTPSTRSNAPCAWPSSWPALGAKSCTSPTSRT